MVLILLGDKLTAIIWNQKPKIEQLQVAENQNIDAPRQWDEDGVRDEVPRFWPSLIFNDHEYERVQVCGQQQEWK